MNKFEYASADSLPTAVSLLKPEGRVYPIAGGTDLLAAIKLNIIKPEKLINLKTIPGLNSIHFDEKEGLRIGALATLDDIAKQDIVRKNYPLLIQAILSAASPQLRNRGTIGGNLNQLSRCWYYRGALHCWLKGGEICYAEEGENYHQAIFGGEPCYTVNPSDLAPALVALDTEIQVIGPETGRVISLEDFFQRPHDGSRQLTILKPGEIVSEVRVPPPAENSTGVYLKATERRVWSFALASVAVQVTFDHTSVSKARMVLGGVSPVPWRLAEAEQYLHNQQLDSESIQRAAEQSVIGAHPLSKNGYKIALVRGLVKEALQSLANIKSQ